MCIFLLAGGLSLLKTTGSPAERLGPVVLWVHHSYSTIGCGQLTFVQIRLSIHHLLLSR